MPKTPIDYTKTIIYKLVCNDLNVKDIYVGSTTDFTRRKIQHKTKCNNKNLPTYNEIKYITIRNNGGWDNWSMIEIEKYPCNDSNEQRARERYMIESLNATMNMVMPIRTIEETKELKKIYKKEYQEQNKDKRLENRDDVLKKKKEYYKTHKETNIKEYQENNKERIKAQRHEYYLRNQEEIKEKVKNRKILNEKK